MRKFVGFFFIPIAFDNPFDYSVHCFYKANYLLCLLKTLMCIRPDFGALAGVAGEDHKIHILYGSKRETTIKYGV